MQESLVRASTVLDVRGLDLVEAREHTGTGDTAQDVGAGATEERRESFVLEDLAGAIERALVLDSFARGHHHATTDGIERVRCCSRKKEREVSIFFFLRRQREKKKKR
jgi:hypothetical protein